MAEKDTVFTCPHCGGVMAFDVDQQKLKCPYCDSTMTITEFQELQQSKEDKSPEEGENINEGRKPGEETADVFVSSTGGAEWTTAETEGMRVFHCDNCGGEVVVDATTGATACPYCGSNLVLKGQFSGALRPDYVVPFKLSREQAMKNYQEFVSKQWLLPRMFRSNSCIEDMRGVYVPFWVFDADAKAHIVFDAEKVSVRTIGKKEYTTTGYYTLERSGMVSFDKVPADCSKKMDDVLMESLEPFVFSDAEPFNTAYLAGFMADHYDEDPKDSRKRAHKRIEQSTSMAFRKTVSSKYQSVNEKVSNINLLNARYWYTLYPVWLLSAKYGNEIYQVAVNGQTGKVVGELPVGRAEFIKKVGIRSAIWFAVLYGLKWLIVLA